MWLQWSWRFLLFKGRTRYFCSGSAAGGIKSMYSYSRSESGRRFGLRSMYSYSRSKSGRRFGQGEVI